MTAHKQISPASWPQPIQEAGCQLLSRLASDLSVAELTSFLLSALGKVLGASDLVVVGQSGKSWLVEATDVADKKFSGKLPESLVASATQGSVSSDGNWRATGIVGQPGRNTCLLASLEGASEQSDQLLIAASQLVGLVQQITGVHAGVHRRCNRLTRMLEIAANWQQEQDSNLLLESIASASTDLIGAERASIFLWDRRRGVLIGRPALGVEGGQLEVDDSAGVVGAVLASREPKRWDATDDESQVNRKVDKKLEFQTHSLLAVPLVNSRKKTIGVFEVINKIDGVFTLDDEQALVELAMQAAAAIENTREKEQLAKSCDNLTKAAVGHLQIIGESAEIIEVRQTAARIAETNLAVLILGKNGTGKEVLAQTIHYSSPRKREPFVAVNCAALVESLLESELFGHEKGAFTDAQETRQGKFEVASGGTLFLDEIGDMSLGGQAKLLRVLEEKVIVRVGGSKPIPIDVRVVAATNQPLAELVSEKRFREDLYFRLNVVTLDLPSLSARGEDVILLAEHFLDTFAHQIGRKTPRLDDSARAALINHQWPGNIRELRNLIERVSYLCSSPVIKASDLSFSASPGKPADVGNLTSLPLNEATRQFQIDHIQRTIDRIGSMTAAAKKLGLHRSNLYRKMKQLDMDVDE